eukprot:4305993-Amphidinium_carterae.1
MAEDTQSVLLEHNGVVENRHVKLAWVASPSEDGLSLRWHVLRFVLSLGYQDTPHQPLSRS